MMDVYLAPDSMGTREDVLLTQILVIRYVYVRANGSLEDLGLVHLGLLKINTKILKWGRK